MDSILTSVKKVLGIAEDYTHFDADLIMHINSTLAILAQMGVGHSANFRITDKTQTWDEFINGDAAIDDVKTYICLKVRYVFDPPSSSSILDAMARTISELEWRLNVAAETVVYDDDDGSRFIVDWGDE